MSEERVECKVCHARSVVPIDFAVRCPSCGRRDGFETTFLILENKAKSTEPSHVLDSERQSGE